MYIFLSALPFQTFLHSFLLPVGAHLLRTLLAGETISTVYCLTRQSSPEDAHFANLRRKQITIPSAWAEQIVALQSDLCQSDLGVGGDLTRQMKKSVSLITHVAWPVNFTLPLTNFEPYIKGICNLVSFSISVDASVPAVLLFCSSISTAPASPSIEVEEIAMEPTAALDMGCSRSKVVGEQIFTPCPGSGRPCCLFCADRPGLGPFGEGPVARKRSP